MAQHVALFERVANATGFVVLYLVLYVIFEWEEWRRRKRRRKE